MIYLICVVVAVCVFFLYIAASGFIRSARGYDEDAVERRLTNPSTISILDTNAGIVHAEEDDTWFHHLPFNDTLRSMLLQAGNNTTLEGLWLRVAIYAVVVFALLMLLLPSSLFPLSLVLSVIGGIAGGFTITLFFLQRAAKKRIEKFTEQLPDAIDLMVRSLHVGHPVIGAMSVIAREMDEPIGSEFKIACDQVTYGNEVPAAFLRMAERIPVVDLKYLTVVMQVQSESGGNLVESLSKLSAVMRGRFRMFRKVRALTVEGRVSAYILSGFPIFIAVALLIVKPDYFKQALAYEHINIIIAVLVVLLIVNIFAMRTITNIKV